MEPPTRTVPAVADKDGKKAAMLAILRFYAETIKRNLGVSNDAKIGLRLAPLGGRPLARARAPHRAGALGLP